MIFLTKHVLEVAAIRLAARFLALYMLSLALESPAFAQPSIESVYQINAYEIRGNTALNATITQTLLSNAIGGNVPLSRICQALASLRQTYLERGYPQVTVALAEQEISNGIVVIDVKEGPGVAKPTPARFEVSAFEVTGNTLLPDWEIRRILAPAIGSSMTLEDVRKAAASLQREYRERGYPTVAVSLPSQRLTNATVRIVVTEGTVESLWITGNSWFSSNNIVRALPSAQTNTILNSHVFQRELDLANQNRDRQIYPTLGPGPDPGTSVLALRVKDRIPFHAHADLNNYSTPGTPDLRANFAAQYDNLWQHEHQLGLAYSFTPQHAKTAGEEPNFGFNQPLISSYSAFYRLPIATGETIGQQMEKSSEFGYQEATRQFRLPPASVNSELVVYASASSSDTGVKWGAPSTVTNTTMLRIASQDSGQNVMNNANIGSQLRFPIFSAESSRWSGFVGFDYKQLDLTSFNTNNILISTVTTNAFGSQTNTTLTPIGQPAQRRSVVYFPLNAGLDFRRNDPRGSTAVGLVISENLIGSTSDFTNLAYSRGANALFGKVALNASREQILPSGLSLLARANGQAATGALISNEQLALGGVNSVRGYYEGDQYGDAGWSGSFELRSPYWKTHVAGISRSIPAWLRASVFTDCGQSFLMDSSSKSSVTLWGTGFSFSANINNYFDARLIVGWPLIESSNTRQYEPRVSFTIGGQF